MLLGVQANHEGGDVDNLLADADVALLDQDTGVVDGLGEAKLVHAGLQTTLKEILDLQGQDVIELHAGLVEDTDTHKTANQGVTLEETLGVLLIKSEQLTKARLVHLVHHPCKSHQVYFQWGPPHTEQHDESWRG